MYVSRLNFVLGELLLSNFVHEVGATHKNKEMKRRTWGLNPSGLSNPLTESMR